MRTRDLHVRLYGLQGTSPVGERAFQISFNYSDRYKAQEVVKELTARFEQLNFELIRQQGMEGKSKIELVSAATLPEIPISPNHMAFVWMGLGGGMLVGLLVALVWRQPKATLRMAGFAAAGAALAIGVGYFIPNVYMSRAVMRVAGTEDFATASGRLNEISEQVLSRGNLASLIQLPQLDLYEKERAHVPLTEIVEKMRSKDLRIQLRQAPESGGAPPFEIGFSYSDRFKAQQAVRELSGQFIRWGMMHNEGYHIEILDNADLPETPAFPNRTNIAILGACAGLLLGIIRQSFFTGGSLRSELPVEPAPDPA
jgi:LPS O-antigen subunit length determinant protein (WzzB/FepE family)